MRNDYRLLFLSFIPFAAFILFATCNMNAREVNSIKYLQEKNDEYLKVIWRDDSKIKELLYLPSDRLTEVYDLLEQQKPDSAKKALTKIIKYFPDSKESLVNSKQVYKDIYRMRLYLDGKKSSTFYTLREETSCTVRYNQIYFDQFEISDTYLYDKRADKISEKKAGPDSKYITGTVSIRSEIDESKLPTFYIYAAENDTLRLVNRMDVNFTSWESEETYKGSAPSPFNDRRIYKGFINFSVGGLLKKETIENATVFILMENQNTLERSKLANTTPPIKYVGSVRSAKTDLTIKDVVANYTVIKIFNQDKLD